MFLRKNNAIELVNENYKKIMVCYWGKSKVAGIIFNILNMQKLKNRKWR